MWEVWREGLGWEVEVLPSKPGGEGVEVVVVVWWWCGRKSGVEAEAASVAAMSSRPMRA